MKAYTCAIETKILFEYLLTRFGCPKILMRDHSMHFLNETISALIEEFQLYHHKSTHYHLQANGTVESFNKIMENTLKMFCNAERSDWDVWVPAVLWTYRTTCKKLTVKTPFRLMYGVETVMLMKYIVPSMLIVALTRMVNRGALEERLV